MNTFLLRQFVGRSVTVLLVAGLALALTASGRRFAAGTLIGGGWMVANCVAMVWMGAAALRHSHGRSGRSLAGFLAALLGSLALGSWLALTVPSVRSGLAIGLSIALAVFLLQLRRLKLTLDSHAR